MNPNVRSSYLAAATSAGEDMGDCFFEMASDAFAILENGRFIRANRIWGQVLGRSPDELLGRHWSEIVVAEDVSRMSSAMADAGAGDGHFAELEARVLHADGGQRSLVWSGYTDSGRWLLCARDVTLQRCALERSDRRGQLLDSVDAAVIATDLDTTIMEWNKGAERLYGWTREEAIGRPVAEVTVAPGQESRAAEIVEAIEREGSWEGEVEVKRKDGSTFPALVRDTLFRDSSGELTGIVGVSVDLTERLEAQHRLESAHGYLRAITESMDEALCTLDEEGKLTYMNAAAERLLGWGREDLTGRLPHDVVHYRRPDGSPYPAGECPLVGAASSSETVRVDDDLFIRADGSEVPVAYSAAPFTTEAGARGLVVVIRDLSERKAKERELAERLETVSWIGRIRDALAENRLVAYAQPIVDLTSGETLHHELLVRMRSKGGSIVLPTEFLPAAEEYGAIRDIDDWMVARAAEFVARGHAVSVNLSVQSVVAPGMLDRLRASLRAAGADPSLLSIELTETAFLTDGRAAQSFVEDLGRLGCSVALDDFGTGYGSFSYLKRLPVDYLKIDREFVRDLVNDKANRHVINAIVSLARSFRHRTVAEGAQDEATLDELRTLGVDYVQGFTVASPCPADDALG